jgi:hypothetical protein
MCIWKIHPFYYAVSKIAKCDYQFRHVSLSVRMEQLGSCWTDFLEI